ncbi:SMP-30/gluconolactonase/LRE family protein [Xanthomonas maliensis]|uniref:SMP-30/gluconolactonase/LRE family protein n=1 Tax=Xanthomonas maliensis TaxID=1321368 RepID=UPI0003AAD7E2|nr:SMP-30/gluconolactonase/LRE family protein [Xanthomonas maliensis]KAB7763199.1 gluconolactonase [Xanthomonas maliensis]
MRVSLRLLVAAMSVATLTCCANTQPAPASHALIGQVSRFDPAMQRLVAADARIERLAEGFTWSEGPTWVRKGGYLLFTDVPQNTLYRWSERDGLSVLLKPSGYAGPPMEALREAGANGLYAAPDGSVLLADSGNRRVARLDPLSRRTTTLASGFDGKRFNSPNDLVRRRDGAVFFTDPPYGLKDLDASPIKELRFNGVYRLDADGSVHLLDDGLSFPNGIALSPDERTLYVSNSDPKRPIWMAYTLDARGAVTGKRVFADASDLVAQDAPGLPDGMAVAADGHLFATGPGGVLVFTPDGRRLGRIETGQPISNCAFGDDGQTLYMTSNAMLTRLRLQVRGLEFTR